MARPASVTPTDGELEILQIVWRLKNPTVRDVYDEVLATRVIDQATITTMMSLMERKGLLRVSDERRPRRFAAISSEKRTHRAMLKHLADKISDGSIRLLLQKVLGADKMTAAEEAQIEKEFGKADN